MNSALLTRAATLFSNAEYMGAADAMRRFLGLAPGAPVPLSVSHGVDFGHCHHPMDVDSIEPIHWSCNPAMLQRSRKVKPSILAPHPWAMLHGPATRSAPPRGELLIGPPPSPGNDQRLYEKVANRAGTDCTVLVKARGAFEQSIAFWQSKGFKTCTARGPDGSFYERLSALLGSHRRVIGCTFSSALVFAASIGCEVELITDYFYEVYEPGQYEDEVDLSSSAARETVRIFAAGNHAMTTEFARALLGFEQLGRRAEIHDALNLELAALPRMFHVNARNPFPYPVAAAGAFALRKPGLLRYSLKQAVESVRRKNMCVMRMNDIDVWLSGKRSENFRLTPIPFIQGVTIPGLAPDGYGGPHA